LGQFYFDVLGKIPLGGVLRCVEQPALSKEPALSKAEGK